MGVDTKITWTDHTWNPWRGCTRVSAACEFCYMARDQKRYGKDPWSVVRAAPTTFNMPYVLDSGKKVFVCSWSDFFHEGADAWREQAWDIIRARPELTFQILTKRPERIRDHLPADWNAGWPNVWLGVTGETYLWLHRRVNLLLAVPAVVHFVSAEPILEALHFPWFSLPKRIVKPNSVPISYIKVPQIDWVIVGGLSGSGWRDHPAVGRIVEVHRACKEAGVPCFVKQDSGPRPGMQGGIPDEVWNTKEFPKCQ